MIFSYNVIPCSLAISDQIGVSYLHIQDLTAGAALATESSDIINKDFISINEPSQLLMDTDYLIITKEILLSAAEELELIHNNLNIEVIIIDDIINLYPDLDAQYAIREYLINRM